MEDRIDGFEHWKYTNVSHDKLARETSVSGLICIAEIYWTHDGFETQMYFEYSLAKSENGNKVVLWRHTSLFQIFKFLLNMEQIEEYYNANYTKALESVAEHLRDILICTSDVTMTDVILFAMTNHTEQEAE